MLTLTVEQEDGLRSIAHGRGLQRIADALTAAFPELAARAGERLPALVAHGALRAAEHGLDDAVCVGRYLAFWFVWGTDFEARPDGRWAGDILRRPGLGQGAKAFQLCRRTAEQLLGRSDPALPTSAAFQTAIVLLDDRLADIGILGSLRPTPPIRLGLPCDIDACDIRLVEPAWRRSYRWTADGGWQWRPSPPGADPVVVLAAGREPEGVGVADEAATPGFPPQIHLLSPSPGLGPAARLRLRTRALHVCDGEHHPRVGLNGARGLSDWRGTRAAAEVLFSLPADPALPPIRPEGLEPAIAVETAPARSVLEAAACGLRDAGAPLGALGTQIAVYPAAQWLLAWEREPVPGAPPWSSSTSSPSPASTADAARPVVRVRLERDGTAIDSARWQAGLRALDAQWAEALSRLLVVWEREAGVSRGRVEAESSLLAGNGGLTWGWAEGPRGLLDAPLLRVVGRCDLKALDLRLQLSGEWAIGGSRSLLQLTLDASTGLQSAWVRDHGQPDLGAALETAQVAFRHPFRLQLTPIADAESAIANPAGPVAGALVGACGLRLCADGPGLQWFVRLAIEAASVPVAVAHPLFGQQRSTRPLLPSLLLLDWSLG